jgi:hypothetical protein
MAPAAPGLAAHCRLRRRVYSLDLGMPPAAARAPAAPSLRINENQCGLTGTNIYQCTINWNPCLRVVSRRHRRLRRCKRPLPPQAAGGKFARFPSWNQNKKHPSLELDLENFSFPRQFVDLGKLHFPKPDLDEKVVFSTDPLILTRHPRRNNKVLTGLEKKLLVFCFCVDFFSLRMTQPLCSAETQILKPPTNCHNFLGTSAANDSEWLNRNSPCVPQRHRNWFKNHSQATDNGTFATHHIQQRSSPNRITHESHWPVEHERPMFPYVDANRSEQVHSWQW